MQPSRADMLAFFVVMVASARLAAAQGAGATTYNTRVHSSVILTHSGERTPYISSFGLQTLTSLGARQLYSVGTAFRDRYMGLGNSTDNPLSINRVVGISNHTIDNVQIYILAPDSQYLIASAQAFIQGLYPPFTLTEVQVTVLDAASILANNTYVEYPLGGYQYAQIESFGPLDPTYIYLAGDKNCIDLSKSIFRYTLTQEFINTRGASANLYHDVGTLALGNVLRVNQWSYDNAYPIYEYLAYEIEHNTAAHDLFAENSTLFNDFNRVRQLASQNQWAYYGNRTADNGIRTIAGQTLAAKVLGQLHTSISTNGSSAKISVLFGDHQPFLSFFSLAHLTSINQNFYGLPDYGSSMVFELYSIGDSGNTTFPNEDELWVKFYFRNGSDTTTDLQAFPLFARGRSETEMPWGEFQSEMVKIMTSSIFNWCRACGAMSIFCYAVNVTSGGIERTGGALSSMSTQVAGVIGAGITLGILSILVVLAMLIGGVRFHRVNQGKKSELGGFKGSTKLPSDADLVLPKAAPVAVGVGIDDTKGRERVGSWELKNTEVGRPVTQDDEDDISVSPFTDPLKPNETV